MLFLILLFGIVFILVFPLKFKVNITNKYVEIYLYFKCILRQESFQAVKEIQEVTLENIQNKLVTKEDLIYLKLIDKFDVLKLNINFSGFNMDYDFLSIIYGFLYNILSFFDAYFYLKNVPFSYTIKYQKSSTFDIFGIFKTNLGKILLEYFRLRRIKNGRASN